MLSLLSVALLAGGLPSDELMYVEELDRGASVVAVRILSATSGTNEKPPVVELLIEEVIEGPVGKGPQSATWDPFQLGDGPPWDGLCDLPDLEPLRAEWKLQLIAPPLVGERFIVVVHGSAGGTLSVHPRLRVADSVAKRVETREMIRKGRQASRAWMEMKKREEAALDAPP